MFWNTAVMIRILHKKIFKKKFVCSILIITAVLQYIYNIVVFPLANPVSWADARIQQSINKDGPSLTVPLYFSILYRQQQLR